MVGGWTVAKAVRLAGQRASSRNKDRSANAKAAAIDISKSSTSASQGSHLAALQLRNGLRVKVIQLLFWSVSPFLSCLI